jgi:hypothetical protein
MRSELGNRWLVLGTVGIATCDLGVNFAVAETVRKAKVKT